MYRNKINSVIKVIVIFFLFLAACSRQQTTKQFGYNDVVKIDSSRIISSANEFLSIKPVTITAFSCKRSLGGKHDFYSEGDYWWPDPNNPDGPYIRKDGLSNPDNFTKHRKVMRSMSIQVSALVAAFKITGDDKYKNHALKHLRAWFINPETLMNPNMNYAQAIKGVCPGRGVGLIDGIHFVEVARAVSVLEKLSAIQEKDLTAIKDWFSKFLNWMTTHEYGIDERERKNNHGSCWVMQAAEYAHLTGNKEKTKYCIERFKNVLLTNQLAKDGSFPLELKRTKPYGYSLFNMDILATVCQILSTPEDNLWTYTLPEGQGIKKAMQFIYPYIKDKSKWPYKQDVMYWDQWPVRQPSLLFTGIAYDDSNYIKLWKKLPPEPTSDEGMRNFPIRQPILWIN